MPNAGTLLTLALVAATPLTSARAQDASLTFQLGRDTVAIEQFTRTPTRFTGEVVRRQPAIQRTQYDVTLGADGRPTRALVRQRQANGSPLATGPTEIRLTYFADSVKRELVFADSISARTIAARRALFILPVPSAATLELLHLAQKAAPADSFQAIGLGGIGWYRLVPMSGDTVRLSGGPYPFHLRFDGQSRLLVVDGSSTANKVVGTRAAGGLDIAAIAARMTPMGAASGRGTARMNFSAGAIVSIDYGRPLVRDRTVWGGTLVPFDSVWRTGANDATHLMTSRPLVFGELTIPAGLYTLWTQHSRSGTTLLVSKQVGVWGTAFDSTQVLGRVPMQLANAPAHVEEFTITVRNVGQNRGAIDLAWGPMIATASFSVR
jgi:hypothetical protein